MIPSPNSPAAPSSATPRVASAREFPVADTLRLWHFLGMSTLAEIENAAVKLSPQQMQELMRFLGEHLAVKNDSRALRNLSPAEREEDLKRWAASHERGPGLPDFAVGRDAIYE